MGLLRNMSPVMQVLSLGFVVYLLSGISQLIFFGTLQMVVGTESILSIDTQDPRLVISYRLFFQVIAFLVAFLTILRLTGSRYHEVVFQERIKLKYVIITVLVFLLAMFLMPGLTQLNEPLAQFLPQKYLELEALGDAQNQKLLVQSDPIQFIFSMIIMAVLPAICEELVFRGFLIKKMLDSGMGTHGIAIFSSLLFAIIHAQPMKFLPMFFFGLCLAYVYLYFRNIKYSMFLHFLINGSQIVMAYLIGTGALPSA
jgi:membrane protease YdiL (CAAX protease family)